MGDVVVIKLDSVPKFPTADGMTLHALWDGGPRGHAGLLDIPAGFDSVPPVDMDQLAFVVSGHFSVDGVVHEPGTLLVVPKGSAPRIASAEGCRLFMFRMP